MEISASSVLRYHTCVNSPPAPSPVSQHYKGAEEGRLKKQLDNQAKEFKEFTSKISGLDRSTVYTVRDCSEIVTVGIMNGSLIESLGSIKRDRQVWCRWLQWVSAVTDRGMKGNDHI